ncbi:Doublecortin domain-containing 5, partial [Paramuricea clavata]
NTTDPNRIWKFTPTGDICSESNPSLVLTWIANENHQVLEDEDKQRALFGVIENNATEENKEAIVESLSSMKDVYGGEKYSVAVLPKLPAKHPAIGTQRWAIKQESLSNIGQWKFSQITNPAWNRKALSWPVNQDGTLNE